MDAWSRPVGQLVLPAQERERILTHLVEALPHEGVGLLAVAPVDGDTIVARRFYPGTNVRRSSTRFEMDVREVVAALRDMDAEGWILGAIVHAHPNGPAAPSRTDLAEAYYPRALMLIASFASEPAALRAWRLEGSGGAWTPVEVPIGPMLAAGGIAGRAGDRE